MKIDLVDPASGSKVPTTPRLPMNFPWAIGNLSGLAGKMLSDLGESLFDDTDRQTIHGQNLALTAVGQDSARFQDWNANYNGPPQERAARFQEFFTEVFANREAEANSMSSTASEIFHTAYTNKMYFVLQQNLNETHRLLQLNYEAERVAMLGKMDNQFLEQGQWDWQTRSIGNEANWQPYGNYFKGEVHKLGKVEAKRKLETKVNALVLAQFARHLDQGDGALAFKTFNKSGAEYYNVPQFDENFQFTGKFTKHYLTDEERDKVNEMVNNMIRSQNSNDTYQEKQAFEAAFETEKTTVWDAGVTIEETATQYMDGKLSREAAVAKYADLRAKLERIRGNVDASHAVLSFKGFESLHKLIAYLDKAEEEVLTGVTKKSTRLKEEIRDRIVLSGSWKTFSDFDREIARRAHELGPKNVLELKQLLRTDRAEGLSEALKTFRGVIVETYGKAGKSAITDAYLKELGDAADELRPAIESGEALPAQIPALAVSRLTDPMIQGMKVESEFSKKEAYAVLHKWDEARGKGYTHGPAQFILDLMAREGEGMTVGKSMRIFGTLRLLQRKRDEYVKELAEAQQQAVMKADEQYPSVTPDSEVARKKLFDQSNMTLNEALDTFITGLTYNVMRGRYDDPAPTEPRAITPGLKVTHTGLQGVSDAERSKEVLRQVNPSVSAFEFEFSGETINLFDLQSHPDFQDAVKQEKSVLEFMADLLGVGEQYRAVNVAIGEAFSKPVGQLGADGAFHIIEDTIYYDDITFEEYQRRITQPDDPRFHAEATVERHRAAVTQGFWNKYKPEGAPAMSSEDAMRRRFESWSIERKALFDGLRKARKENWDKAYEKHMQGQTPKDKMRPDDILELDAIMQNMPASQLRIKETQALQSELDSIQEASRYLDEHKAAPTAIAARDLVLYPLPKKTSPSVARASRRISTQFLAQDRHVLGILEGAAIHIMLAETGEMEATHPAVRDSHELVEAIKAYFDHDDKDGQRPADLRKLLKKIATYSVKHPKVESPGFQFRAWAKKHLSGYGDKLIENITFGLIRPKEGREPGVDSFKTKPEAMEQRYERHFRRNVRLGTGHLRRRLETRKLAAEKATKRRTSERNDDGWKAVFKNWDEADVQAVLNKPYEDEVEQVEKIRQHADNIARTQQDSLTAGRSTARSGRLRYNP